MLSRRRSLASALVPLFAITLLGCSFINKLEGKGGDAGIDAGVAVAVVDAAVPPSGAPQNVNQVGRFPDEVSLGSAEAKIADPQVAARNAVPGGVLVATLRLGTPVTQVAKHEGFILCVFTDPKSPTRTLEGWIAEQAFVAGPTVPKKAACPKGQTMLIFDEQDFCGKVCKADADCGSGQACVGKANLLTGGKAGAEASTCTVLAGGAGGAGAVIGAGDAGAPHR